MTHGISLCSEEGCSLPGKHWLPKLWKFCGLRLQSDNTQLKNHWKTSNYSFGREPHTRGNLHTTGNQDMCFSFVWEMTILLSLFSCAEPQDISTVVLKSMIPKGQSWLESKQRVLTFPRKECACQESVYLAPAAQATWLLPSKCFSSFYPVCLGISERGCWIQSWRPCCQILMPKSWQLWKVPLWQDWRHGSAAKSHAVLAEDLSSISRTHIGWLSTCNSSSQTSHVSWPPQAPTCTYPRHRWMYTPIIQN